MPFLIPFACGLVVPAGVAAWGAWRHWPLGVAAPRVALAGYLALLLAMTLTASPFHGARGGAGAAEPAGVFALASHLNLVPLRSIRRYITAPWPVVRVELLGNIAAFVPFGVLVPLAWGHRLRWWQVLGAGVALSVGIEVAQFALVPARVADVDDVLLNAPGVAAGLALACAALGVTGRRAVMPTDARLSNRRHRSAASRSNTCL